MTDHAASPLDAVPAAWAALLGEIEAVSNEFGDGKRFELGEATDGSGRPLDEEAFATFGDPDGVEGVSITVSGDNARDVAELIVLAGNLSRTMAAKAAQERQSEHCPEARSGTAREAPSTDSGTPAPPDVGPQAAASRPFTREDAARLAAECLGELVAIGLTLGAAGGRPTRRPVDALTSLIEARLVAS